MIQKCVNFIVWLVKSIFFVYCVYVGVVLLFMFLGPFYQPKIYSAIRNEIQTRVQAQLKGENENLKSIQFHDFAMNYCTVTAKSQKDREYHFFVQVLNPRWQYETILCLWAEVKMEVLPIEDPKKIPKEFEKIEKIYPIIP